ncbi:MAG: alpha/beta fold hydrolase [Dehalococcoidia bacterium]
MSSWLFATLFIVLCAQAMAWIGSSGPPAVEAGVSGGLVEIGGGRRLYLECRGQGGPTVILEAGYRSPATVWTDDLVQPEMPRTMVFEGVARFSRVCLYERPGVLALIEDGLHTSRSDPVPQPRTAESVVADLHTLLRAAAVPGPYMLVGHSLGGMFVRLYAATYPDEVVGLVEVDAWYEGLKDLLSPADWEAYVRLNFTVPLELAGNPEFAALGFAYETLDFAAASEVMRRTAAARPLPPMPLAVLSHGQPFGLSEEALGFSPDALEEAWSAAQHELAALVPDTDHVIATDGSHYIQLEEPELVIDAIRAVVDAVRDPASWTVATKK